jgi:hypothetical protein
MFGRILTSTEKEHQQDRARTHGFFGEIRTDLEEGRKYFDRHRAEVDRAGWEEMLEKEKESEAPVADALAVLLGAEKPSEVRAREQAAANVNVNAGSSSSAGDKGKSRAV